MVNFCKKIFASFTKNARFTLITSLSTGLVLLLWLTNSVAQNSGELGFEFEGSPNLNATSIYTLEYTGECPGRAFGSKKAWFISSEISPAPGRRVIIKNVSRGLSRDPYPFTNRDYSKGNTSEATSIAFDTKHRGSFFSVLEGNNQFEYEIKEKDQVVGNGSFTAQIDSRTERQQRNATCELQSYCAKEKNVPLNQCSDVRTRQICKCPNGTNFYR